MHTQTMTLICRLRIILTLCNLVFSRFFFLYLSRDSILCHYFKSICIERVELYKCYIRMLYNFFVVVVSLSFSFGTRENTFIKHLPVFVLFYKVASHRRNHLRACVFFHCSFFHLNPYCGDNAIIKANYASELSGSIFLPIHSLLPFEWNAIETLK